MKDFIVVDTPLEKSKKKKVNKVRNYGTRCMKVGEIKCLFLSCFNGGRSPFICIGPSWPFTFVLFFIAAFYYGIF